MNEDKKINHVSDTAIWVATFRARETERADAVFKDPLASFLVGDRGRKIAASMPFPKIMAWVMTVRTVAIDRLIMKALELGVDTVLNLGAGLDTRPYRMQLPATLRWVEVDFPHMIEFKNEKLKTQNPVCRLERIATDLSNPEAKQKLFKKIGDESKKVLIITEGLIPYLSNEDAEALSTALASVPTFKYWIQDYRQGGLANTIPKRMSRRLKSAPFLFKIEDWHAFFGSQGWAICENILAFDETKRIGRSFPFVLPWSLFTPFLSKKTKEKFRVASGYVMYENQKT